MKEAELRKHTACSFCGKKLLSNGGLPLFWRVTVERFGIDMMAVQRQHGLGMVIGSAAIASVMGPDEDLAKPMQEPATLTICEICATRHTCVAHLAELGNSDVQGVNHAI